MWISTKAWLEYIGKMSAISNEAAKKMQDWVARNGFANDKALLDYAFALSQHYGTAIATLSCEMYDKTAQAQKANVAPAEPADLPTYGEVAKVIHGAKKKSEKEVPRATARMVKQVGADTTLKNAGRDRAQCAWVPYGDTCAFCITLASRGWEDADSKDHHAKHIHANCDCQYATRFDKKSGVAGYDPQKYLDMYNNAAPNGSPDEKIRAMRRLIEKQNRQLEIDSSDSINLTRNIEFEAFKVKESRYGAYISEKASKKTQNFNNIEKALDTAIETLEIDNSDGFTKIFILSQEEMGTNALASYNPIKNEMYISDVMGNKRKAIELQTAMGFADPKSADSTVRHELIHWKDAKTYREKATINNIEEYKEYLKILREDCKIKLDEIGISAENANTISEYAETSYALGKFEEVYTEYRV